MARFVLSAFAVLLLSSCATLFSPGPSVLRIESDPAGAKVVAQNGETWGTAPFTRTEKPKKDAVLTFTAAGHDTQVITVSRTIKPVAFLNLFNVLFWGIDFATGNVWKYDETYVKATLAKRTSAMSPDVRREFVCSGMSSAVTASLATGQGLSEAVELVSMLERVSGVQRESCSVR